MEEDVNYLMNIVENLGSDAARQYYWDFGRWSDLWRVWRPPGDDRLPGDGIDLQALRCPCHDSVQYSCSQQFNQSVGTFVMQTSMDIG